MGFTRPKPPSHTVDIDLLRSVETTCAAFQTVNQTTVCDALLDACKNVNVQCGNEADQVFICNGNQVQEAVSVAMMARGKLENVDFRPTLGLPPDATDTQVKVAIEAHITNTCSGTQDAASIIKTNFDCQDSSEVVVNALNRLDQTTMCGVVAGSALYKSAAGEKDTPGASGDGTGSGSGFVPVPPPTGTAQTLVIITVLVTVVLLVIIILCGALIGQGPRAPPQT